MTNNVVTGMTSAMNPHGGQESTLLSLYTSLYHWGVIVVAPRYTDQITYAAGGNPYGTSVAVDMKWDMQSDGEIIKKAVSHQVKRTLDIGRRIWR